MENNIRRTAWKDYEKNQRCVAAGWTLLGFLIVAIVGCLSGIAAGWLLWN